MKLLNFLVILTCWHHSKAQTFDIQHYFIPTQEQFVVQQSQLFHNNANPGGSQATAIASGNSGGSSSGASAFSFGLGPSPQFFGGSFGLGFAGFGGGWYPHPHPLPPPPFPQQPTFPFPVVSQVDPFRPKLTDVIVPTLLKPSDTGWDTSYNVPCGSYRIRPFVVANLKLATTTSPFHGRRKKKRSNGDERDHLQNQSQRSHRSYFPHFPIRQPRTCSWSFDSDGPCKLKFKCIWFQLPALFSCAENYLFVSDSTSNLNSTFCGNRKPRKVYSSSSGKLALTFKSESTSLPAVLDCAVTCSLETPGSGPTSSNFDPPKVIPIKSVNENNTTSSTTLISPSVTTATSLIISEGDRSTRPSEEPTLGKIRVGNCKCGVQDGNFLTRSRIVGGSATQPVEFPWVVALVKKQSSLPFCGGTLISDRYVITAAHCVIHNKLISRPRRLKNAKDLFDVLLLEHNINRIDEVPGGGTIRLTVDKIIVHPKYDNVTFDFDVALLRLSKEIDLNQSDTFMYDGYGFNTRGKRFLEEIQATSILEPKPVPICLPSGTDTRYEDGLGIITGWGLQSEGGIPSEELLKATVQIFNDTECKAVYKKFNYPVTETMMCAGTTSGKIDSCVGDSGGGLIVQESDRFVLTGITSWGRGCGRIGQPGVYTKIPGLMKWIRSEASDGLWCGL